MSDRPPLSRRLAAVGALVAPVAIVVALLVALHGSVGILLVAIALEAIIVTAGWFTLTRRGPRRVAGAMLTTVAVAGLVVVLATHWHGILVVALIAALFAGFGAAARYALGPPESPAVAVDAAVTGEPEPAALIINLKSGGGKAQRFGLVEQAHSRGIEPIVLTPGDDLLELAEGAIDRGARVVGMAGGDGSQALVATVVSRRDVAHVCIPAGTRNHFALDLGLDRDDVLGALDAFTDGIERRIDLATVNDRVFVNNASLGVYAKVVQSDAYRDAKLETWTKLLPDLLGPDAPPIDLRFAGPDGATFAGAALVLVSNNVYELTQFAGAGSRPKLDAGELGIVAARVQGEQAATLVALELAGQASRFPGVMMWSVREFVVDSGAPIEVGLDGEALVLEAPLRFATLPGALRVRVPRAAGLAPAATAVAVTPQNLGALLRVAGGR